jgi:hypothetical protein
MAEKMDVEARIAHFLRVSEDAGATQAERDTAGREAERLLAKHAIDRLTLDVEGRRRAEREPIERVTLPVPGGRGTVALDVALGLIAVAAALGLVAHYRDRRTVLVELDGPGATPHVELVVTGFRSDLALAVPLLQSLHTQATLAVRSWWRGDPRHRLLPRWDALLARCAFARAFGQGAADRLRATRDSAIEGTGTALVVADREAAVQEWLQQHVHARSRADRRSFSGYGRAPGYAAGLRSTGSAKRALGGGGSD